MTILARKADGESMSGRGLSARAPRHLSPSLNSLGPPRVTARGTGQQSGGLGATQFTLSTSAAAAATRRTRDDVHNGQSGKATYEIVGGASRVKSIRSGRQHEAGGVLLVLGAFRGDSSCRSRRRSTARRGIPRTASGGGIGCLQRWMRQPDASSGSAGSATCRPIRVASPYVERRSTH
jgi:hypothetical protein